MKPLRAGFSIIELMAVLAVLTILASIVVPNLLTSLDTAAARAEEESLQSFAQFTRLHYQRHETMPTSSTWTTDLGRYTDIAPDYLTMNHRRGQRSYLPDPSGSARAIFVSSVRPELAIPDATDITSPADFDAIWETSPTDLPPTSSWSGWSDWHDREGSEAYLVLQRVNLQDLVDLAALEAAEKALHLAASAGSPSYQVTTAEGVTEPYVNMLPGDTISLAALESGDVVRLYAQAHATTLQVTFTYVESPATFVFDGSSWSSP